METILYKTTNTKRCRYCLETTPATSEYWPWNKKESRAKGSKCLLCTDAHRYFVRQQQEIGG